MSRRSLPENLRVDLSSQELVFASIVRACLPVGGMVMAVIEAHFDESEGFKSRRLFCLAGYLMTDRAARRLTREWTAVLKAYDLPYFRMSECAHGNGPFKALSKDDRVAVERSMIEIIKSRTIQGVSAIIDLDEFDAFVPPHPLIKSHYVFCAHVVIGGVASWIEEERYAGDVAYFFEAGHSSQSQANGIMQQTFTEPDLKDALRYAAHSFIDKAKSPPTQAADLLSWQTCTDYRHQAEGRPRRKDYKALLRKKDQCVFITREMMEGFASGWANDDDSLARLYLGNGG